MKWKLEQDVNDWVKSQFSRYGLEKLKDYNEESGMSDFMKEALKGSAKTDTKTNFGKPDFHVEKYRLPVIIENKLKLSKLVSKTKSGVKFDDKSIRSYAVNGALYYARNMIASEKYSEVIAIGIAGDDEQNVKVSVYYVFGSAPTAYKELEDVSSFSFLESDDSFNNFYKNATLSEEEKHRLLIDSKETLNKYAKKLNKLMHNLNITAPQRVLYVSGMLLSMQDVVDTDGTKIDNGLIPGDLKGIQAENKRDSKEVVNKIDEFLSARQIPENKKKLMLASFKEISKDSQRDELADSDKEVSKLIDGKASATKQIFVFIYEYIYKSIDGLGGSLDVMGEMYSEFLKYALGDGKELGIVLTPPYVTKMMAQILNINKDSRVMDLATGSAGFLIASMEVMINDANKTYGKGTKEAEKAIQQIKKHNLLGVELNAEMYTLATTNMILRGDGSSKIEKGSAFNRPESLFTDFKGNRILLNPPFSFKGNGLPFIAYGLDKLEKGGLGAIIIQDSAGAGKAVDIAKEILSKHTLLASIKMPVDLFVPMAGVQTSIYIFEAGTPHDYDKPVKFIDFRNDGYKRAKRGIAEIDNPIQRYQDIVKIYKAGKAAKVSTKLWNLDDVVVEDFITDKGNDWNFDQHVKIDITPTLNDFQKTVSDYLSWEVSKVLKDDSSEDDASLGKYRLGDLFEKISTNKLNYKTSQLPERKMKEFTLPALTAGIQNQGLNNYVPKNNATILKQVISISANGANTGATFYQKHPFTVLQDAYAIKLKKNELSKLNDNQYLFFVSAISKSISNMFEWTNKATWERVKERKISLPTKKGNIDYDFMDSFVAELEAQRVAELEAYLQTTGLNDYELTDEEKKVLSLSEKTASNEVRYSADNAKNETIKFKLFKLGELFKSQTGDVDLQQKDINGKGVYFVNSGNTNYGIKGKTDRKAKIFLKNTITIDFFGNAYYRNYEYKLATHNHVFSLSGNVIKNYLVGQYLISTMQYLTKIYGYSLMATWTKLKENEIKLPVTENGEINFDYMEKYITAIEKLTIKNVVEYKDKLIKQTKKLVD